MTDTPLMLHDSPVRRLELEAIRQYREKYPDAPPWQELQPETRSVWIRHAEAQQTKETP